MEPAPRQRMTEEEYLAFERASQDKHEYINGEVYLMAGGTLRHSVISGNVLHALIGALAGRGCVVTTSNLRVGVTATRMYTYPDVAVACGRIRTHPLDPNTLVNPGLIVEVLSESTESHDRGAKFAHYRQMESLQEYVLVSQAERRVEHFRRIEPNQWVLTEYVGDGDVRFPVLDVTIPLAAFYAQLDLLDEATSSDGGDG